MVVEVNSTEIKVLDRAKQKIQIYLKNKLTNTVNTKSLILKI